MRVGERYMGRFIGLTEALDDISAVVGQDVIGLVVIEGDTGQLSFTYPQEHADAMRYVGGLLNAAIKAGLEPYEPVPGDTPRMSPVRVPNQHGSDRTP